MNKDNTSQMTDEDLEELAGHVGFGLDTGYRSRFFGLIQEIPEGSEIPAWHGVWRYNHAQECATTAIVGLNLLLALAWRLIGWVKSGGLRVAADPRQAFVDGLNAGHEAAVNELPEEVRQMRDMALAKEEAAHRALQQYGPMLRLRSDFQVFIDNLNRMQRPSSETGAALVDHLQKVAAELKLRMDSAYGKVDESATTPPAA